MITTDIHGSLGAIMIDDGKVNAFTLLMIQQLQQALEDMSNNDDITAVILCGRDGIFSAGFDLKTMKASAQARRELVCAGAELSLYCLQYPKPLIMAVTGHAYAMGALLLCTADYRIGTTGNSKIALNEVAIGLTMPQFGIQLLETRINPKWTERIIAQAEELHSCQAIEAGFLDQAVDELSVIDLAAAQAQKLSNLDRAAFVQTRARLRQSTIEQIRTSYKADIEELTKNI